MFHVPPQPYPELQLLSAAQWLSCRCGGKIKALTVPGPGVPGGIFEVHPIAVSTDIFSQSHPSTKRPSKMGNFGCCSQHAEKAAKFPLNILKHLETISQIASSQKASMCAGARLVPRLLPSSQHVQ